MQACHVHGECISSETKLYMCLVAKSCLTLCNPMECIACQAPLSMGFPGKNIGVGCHFLLQGIFLTQEWNLSLLRLLPP